MAVAGAGPPEEPWVPLLRRLAVLREEMEAVEYEMIMLIRASGATWQAIGDELGISRQRAQQRFRQPRKRYHLRDSDQP